MPLSRGALRRAPAALLVLALTACGDTPSDALSVDGAQFARFEGVTSEQADLLKRLKQVTARYNSVRQAEMADYEITPCVPGMGYHHANFGLVDAHFDPLEPEVLLYERKKNGQLQLVAIEYIVIGTEAPDFAGKTFDERGAPLPPEVPHHTLHVWLYKHNPDGMFAAFNPTVSCPAGGGEAHGAH